MPSIENDLHRFLVENAPVGVVEDEVESSPVVEVEKEKTEKAKKGKKGKGKAAPAKAPSTANVATHSATKAAAEASVAPDVMEVGSPSMGPLPIVEPPSQSEAPISQLPPEVRKRKAVASVLVSPPRASSLCHPSLRTPIWSLSSSHTC